MSLNPHIIPHESTFAPVYIDNISKAMNNPSAHLNTLSVFFLNLYHRSQENHTISEGCVGTALSEALSSEDTTEGYRCSKFNVHHIG